MANMKDLALRLSVEKNTQPPGFTSSAQEAGVSSGPLMMIEQPDASAQEIFRTAWLIGKFHGVNAATGPTTLFVPLQVLHPVWMIGFLVLTSVTFSLVGFIIGIWADGFEKLQFVPMLIVTPLTFLGGSFYSVDMLPPFWRTVSLFNPVVYLVSGFRWSFFGTADVSLGVSLGAILAFLGVSLAVVSWIFKTGYRLKA